MIACFAVSAGVIVGSATPALAQSSYYVRADGGSELQCTGLTDAAYPGSGTNQACAWDHPFRALPPGGPARIAGGDTLVIGAGSYRMGYGAPGAVACDSGFPWDCYMAAVPSGPAPASPTRILGAGWNGGCPAPPVLWGAERSHQVVNLSGSSNVEIACLEITDHEGCVDFHSGAIACERNTYPYGDWAEVGLYAEDSSSVELRDLDIHGLAHNGVRAGRLTDWTVSDVRIAGNGWAGWDGDIDGGDSNSGTLRFTRWTVEWNGCGETWPGGVPSGCWGQTAGGYGDGVGTGATAGHWIVEDSAFLHNTSDGLDLLYLTAGSSVEIRRTIAEGNAGNQIKSSGPTLIENTIVVGNCGYFDGQSFTYNVDDCRALGNAVSLSPRQGDTITIANSTLTSEGDCLVIAGCGAGADGSESVVLRNDIFKGHTDFLQPFENTCFTYHYDCPSDPFDADYSMIVDTKSNPCPGAHDICGSPLGLMNAAIDNFDARLAPGSAAIDSGLGVGGVVPNHDFSNFARPFGAGVDRGAYEWDSVTVTTTTSTTTTSTTTTTTLVSLCPASPAAGCRSAAPGRAILNISDRSDDGRDRLQWKWRKGQASSVAELCDSLSGFGEYRLCIYDSSGNAQPLIERPIRTGTSCGSKPCWRATGTTGCLYKDRSGTPDGITQAKLRAGATGRAQVQVKGAGSALQPPALSPAGLVLPVTVQLLIDDGASTECWSATYSAAGKNGPELFKAKGP